jgi:hypothetical protein
VQATKKEEGIILDIYRELYKESTPIGDFDKLISSEKKDVFFMDYEIPEETFFKILESHLKGKRITKLKKQAIRNTILLGCSPKFTNPIKD